VIEAVKSGRCLQTFRNNVHILGFSETSINIAVRCVTPYKRVRFKEKYDRLYVKGDEDVTVLRNSVLQDLLIVTSLIKLTRAVYVLF
jgi:hypothetical protein